MLDLAGIIGLGLVCLGVLYWLFRGEINGQVEKKNREQAEAKIRELEKQALEKERLRREQEEIDGKKIVDTHDAPGAGGMLSDSLSRPPD